MPNSSSLQPYSSTPKDWGTQIWNGVEVNCSENLNQILHSNYEVIKKWYCINTSCFSNLLILIEKKIKKYTPYFIQQSEAGWDLSTNPHNSDSFWKVDWHFSRRSNSENKIITKKYILRVTQSKGNYSLKLDNVKIRYYFWR